MHFNSPPEKVYEALATDEGRARFWAESTIENEDVIEFQFSNHQKSNGKILRREPQRIFSVEYFASQVTFELKSDEKDGTDLFLTAENVDEENRMEMVAGWISVLMAMKAAVDFSVDLRNHDPKRSWTNGYADN